MPNPKTPNEIAYDKNRPDVYEFASAMKESFKSVNSMLNQSIAGDIGKDLQKYADALEEISIATDENVIQENLDKLKGFKEFMQSKPGNSDKTVFQVLYSMNKKQDEFLSYFKTTCDTLGLPMELGDDGITTENMPPFTSEHLKSADLKKEAGPEIKNEAGVKENPAQKQSEDFEALPKETKNAIQWIDQFKKDSAEDLISQHKLAARIFAARILVNSVRGRGSSLKKPVSGKAIDKLAGELLENDTFKEFLNGMENEEIQKYLCKSGHGGEFEDKFKDYLLNLPGGELHNDRVLDRFMPKAVDRIEALQEQMRKQKKDPDADWSSNIAETVILRGMVAAKRFKKESLSVRIPTNTDLSQEVEDLATDEDFLEASRKEGVRSDFLEGHGGQMLDNMFKAEPGSVERLALEECGKGFSSAQRLKNFQIKVEDLKESLEEEMKIGADSDEVKDLCSHIRDVISQAVALSIKIHAPGVRNPKIAPPLNEVQSAAVYVNNSPTFKEELFPNNDPQKYLDEANKFAEAGNPDEYAVDVTNKLQATFAKKNPNVETVRTNRTEPVKPLQEEAPKAGGPKFG